MVQLTDRPHFSPSTSQTSSDAVADDDSPPSKSPLSDGATPPSSTSSPALPETPPSPVESEDSELHARRRAAKFGTAPALIELPKRVDDGDDVAAQEAAVRAHLRKKRRRRSLFLSLRLSYPSLSKASAAQAAAVPPALPSSGVPLPPPAPGMEPVGSSPLSPTHQQPVLRRPRRRSTLTAATDIPWTPPSPLQTTDEHHSKVSVKVRRALSLLAHGDGHHHRQHSATDPAQRQGSVDGLSRRESKRREKAEVGSAGGGVLLREVFVDSPRDEYFGRRESILRNLRALSTHSGGPGSSRAGASSLRRGAPAGTIGEEPELEGRLDRFDSRLTARSIAPSVGSSAGGGGDGGGGAGEQGWLPRINTPVGEASHRWRGKTNPFAEAVPPSAMGSPRPSLSASPRPSFLSSSFGPDDRPLAGSMTPVTSRNGGGFAPDVLPPPPRLAMTTLSPLQGQQFRQGHSGSPPPPSHARPVSPHPSIHSTGRMSPTGRRSPNGHDLLPPIHLSAPTPTKALTPASTASGLPAEPEWAAVHSSPESPYNLNLTGGLLSGGPGGRAMSPSMSFESLFTPPTQTQPLPSAPRSQHAESSTAAARRRMLSALDTTLPGQQRQLLLPNNGGGFEMSRMGSSTLGSEGSALDLGELAVGAPTKSDARPASARASSRRESIARRADTMCLGQESGEVVWERLWENQRGSVVVFSRWLYAPASAHADPNFPRTRPRRILFFGNPRFSARMLLPNEPANFTRPGLTKDGCKTPYNLRNFQVRLRARALPPVGVSR